MSYIRNIKRTGIALLAVAGLACGQKPSQPKEENKTPSTTTAPVTQPELSQGAPAPAGQIEALSQVPSSSFLAVAFGRPEASLKQAKDLLSRSGLPTAIPDIQEGLAEFQGIMGFDFFDAEAIKKMTGVDPSKGIVFALESQLLGKDVWLNSYSATVDINKDPTPYLVFGVTDPAAFDTWLRASVKKESPSARFEDAKVGDLKAVYMYEQRENFGAPPAPSAPGAPASVPVREELVAAMVSKDKYMYFFMLDVDSSPIPEVPDPIAPFKADLKAFFDRVSSPMTGTPSFQSASKKVDLGGDVFFYMDTELLAKLIEQTETREIIFLTPKNPQEQKAQDDEKRYTADRVKRDAEDIEMFKNFASVSPAMAMSMTVEEKQAVCKGHALVGSSRKAPMEKVFQISTEAPAFATILPESTTSLSRLSINPGAFKEFIYGLLSAEMRKDFDEGIQDMNRELAPLGIEFEKDILGAFTGHAALSASLMEAGFFLFFSARPGGPMPKPPSMVGVAQLTSPDAGDKLLGVVALALAGEKAPVKSEVINGDTLYSLEMPPVSFAWGRTGNLLIGGLDAAAVKEAFQRAQKPGASFADKLGGQMAKDMAEAKSANGTTMDLGAFFTLLTSMPGDASDKAAFAPLSKFFGQTTMQILYEDGGLTCQGEMILK